MGKTRLSSSNKVVWLALLGTGIGLVAACGVGGPQDNSSFEGTGADGGVVDRSDGSLAVLTPEGSDPDFRRDAASDAKPFVDTDAYYFKDPPPQWCGPEGGAAAPPPPSGTADCPGDKNREGCPCDTLGAKAACWPGPRTKRGQGQCKDGVTTCQRRGELGLAWGPCDGAVLPDPGATSGAAACQCFSKGLWALQNTMICGSSAGSYFASRDLGPSVPPNASVNDICPGSSSYPFTKNTLKVDCEGTFDLCFTVRAFNASGKTVNDATTQDCALMPRQCTGPSEYPTRDVTKALSDLKYWTSSNAACANNFTKYGGYAELSVKGQSYLCEKVDDGNNGYRVFYRIRYCSPNETNCTSGASGPFGN